MAPHAKPTPKPKSDPKENPKAIPKPNSNSIACKSTAALHSSSRLLLPQRKLLSNLHNAAHSQPKLSPSPSENNPARAATSAGSFHRLQHPRSATQPQPPPRYSTKPRIPATDPKVISKVWSRVMAENSGYRMSPGLARRKATRAAGPASHTGSSTSTRHSSTVSGSTSRTNSGNITIDNPSFRELVLVPRKITIDAAPLSKSSFSHFKTTPPAGSYKDFEGLRDTMVWLDGDETFRERVVAEYRELKEDIACEADYAHYALQYLLKSEDKDPSKPPPRAWKTKRLIQPFNKPRPRLWCIPPPIEPVSQQLRRYNFDVRPDSQYWIPISVFNAKYGHLVKELTYARNGRTVLPYLTIGFKKDDVGEETPENQVAVAGSVALYNRFQLKELRLRKAHEQWTEKHLDLLRHYGITFCGEAFTAWCIRPILPRENTQVENSWIGCKMESVHKDELDTEVGVQSLMDWVNEIHRWGLTVHGPDAQGDIKRCIEAEQLARGVVCT